MLECGRCGHRYIPEPGSVPGYCTPCGDRWEEIRQDAEQEEPVDGGGEDDE